MVRKPGLRSKGTQGRWPDTMRMLAGAHRIVVSLACVVAAILLASEICLLASSVVARYVFHSPIIWSDELAGALFLWLVVIGAALALQQGQHLKLSVLTNVERPAAQGIMAAATSLMTALFTAIVLYYGVDYAQSEAFMTSPGLGLSNAWRAAALPIGAFLLLETALVQLFTAGHKLGHVMVALALVSGATAMLWLASDMLADLGNWNLLIFFVGLLPVALLIGLPIAFAFGLVTFAYLGLTTDTPLSVMLERMDGGMSNVLLIAIPLFVFLGKLMEATGMARALVGFIVTLVGHIRGGLSYALLGAMYVVSGISGAKTADMAAVAPVLFPEMLRQGENGGEMVSLLAASAVMSETIPPSLVLIAIATTVGVSISALFTAGLLPALIAAIALCGLVYLRTPASTVSRQRPGIRLIGRSFLAALPGLMLPFIIRFAVVGGVATATEVSTVGIAYTIVVGLAAGGRFPWRRLGPMLVDTAVLSGALLLILGAANAMAWALTQSGFSDQLSQALTHMPGGRFGFLGVAILVFVVFGSVLEGLPAIALFGPLLFPIARSFGLHDVHFAILAILAMGLGLYMPPFGIGYYSACIIGGIDPNDGLRLIWPYLGLLLGVIVLIAAVPALSTMFLP